jgi:hypothetical protein
MKIKEFSIIFFALFLTIVSGCLQKGNPSNPTPVNTPVNTVLNLTPVGLHLCVPAQQKDGLVLINSRSDYDAYVADNRITPVNAPPAIDYTSKTLVGNVDSYISANIAFKFNSIVTDGTTTTINAVSTETYCPNPNIQLIEGCGSWFTIADKITTPVVLKVTKVWVDCSGNTISEPTGSLFVQATPTL